MNKPSTTILWLGLIMIMFQIIRDWPEIKQALFQPSSVSGNVGNFGGVPYLVPPGLPKGGVIPGIVLSTTASNPPVKTQKQPHKAQPHK